MKKQIIVTTSWDDGHKSDLKLAKLLKKYDIKGTFYISPKNREWKKAELMSEDEIKIISEDFEIGAHSMTHPILTRLDEKNAYKEIYESKKYLESIIKNEVKFFCYPRGAYNERIKELVKKVGFIGARTTKRHFIDFTSDPFDFGTTVHTYNHKSDIFKIVRFSKFNPLEFYKNLDWEYLAKRRFDYILEHGGTFHLWGHSWEMDSYNQWDKLENVLAYISKRKNVEYLTNSEIITNQKNNKIKLLIVTPYFYPETGGGANYVYNLSKGLVNKHGFEVIIVTPGENTNISEIKTSEMKVYRLKRWFKISNTPINPLWYFQIKKVIKKENPDVINAHMPVPFISDVTAMVCGNTPFILTYHHAGSMKKNIFLPDIIIWLYEKTLFRKILKKAKKIICASDFVRLNYLKDYSNKTLTITPGIDINRFKPMKIHVKNKILFVANLKKAENYKGLEYLLLAIPIVKSEIKNIKLIVVGSGDHTDYYKKLCQKLKINRNVIFKGKLIDENLVREYQQTNVLVLPSLFESCPTVLLEAMACEKPVIGTNICGIPYIIKNEENGLLFPPKDSKALAEAIITILNNPIFAKSMGENGYKKVKENFTWEKQIKKTNDLFTEII